MRPSKSQRGGWLRGGVALAGALALSGLFLLFLAQPISTALSERTYDEDGVEVRVAGRDAPWSTPDAASTDAPASRPRPFAPWRPAAAEVEDTPPASPPPADLAESPPPPRGVPRPDLGAVLRVGGLACLGEREAGLPPSEREACRETLGALAGRALDLPTPMAADKRAGYDAVARSQAPRRAIVPLAARGGGGLFSLDDRPKSSRGPRVGCAARFGLNADRAGGGSGGPCFVRLPGGAPPEAGIRQAY